MPETTQKQEPAQNTSPVPATAPVVAPAAAAKVAAAIPGVTADELQAAIRKILAEGRQTLIAATQLKEPDWSKVTEKDLLNPAVFIPIVEHDIPDYMRIVLKDGEYEAVWANKDQRRIGQLKAEGYELLRREHIHPDFHLPLNFDSGGDYVYADVIALRVHKRILYGKRKKALEISMNQLKNKNRPPRTKIPNSFELADPVQLDPLEAFYEPAV